MEGGGRLMNNQTNDRINENHVAIDQALLLFHMLSNPTRFNILFLLSVEEMNVKELERRIGIPIAMGILYLFGVPLLSPIFAGAAMSLSSVSVLLNALRLKGFKPAKVK